MNFLPGWLFALFLSGVCLGDEHEPVSTSVSDPDDSKLPVCPGICKDPKACTTSLNETSCLSELVCCVDHHDKIATTEFADSDFTTESLESSVVPEVEEEIISEEVLLTTESDMIESDSDEVEENVRIPIRFQDGVYVEGEESYGIGFSEETNEAFLEPAQMEQISQQEAYGGRFCPGTCVFPEMEGTCSYVIRDDSVCADGHVCCLTQEDYQRTVYTVEEEKPSFVKRSTDRVPAQYNCPGTCVHPMHSSKCQTVLNQYSCPLNTKCCVLAVTQHVMLREPTTCTGICLPFRMFGYCIPPNELLMGPSTCPPEQHCCMMNPSNVQPPHFSGMSYPNRPLQSNGQVANDVLGHLAVDELGTVFQVSNRGHVTPLQKLPVSANMQDFVRMATYPRVDGELIIYADHLGTLYQKFYPRNPSAAELNAQMKNKPNLHRQPVQPFESQASEQPATFQQSTEAEKLESDVDSDIVIPDDNDEVPVTAGPPASFNDKSTSPQCPGSCMSYFLRFTCFRGYAIYDGFTCPGRSVCCARLKDIEDHEQYLKSLSPYFNIPPASRDSNLPRCGIKGWRDTPRIMGGKESLPGEWCWQVAIINVQNQYICGGALIDNSWVLTAAHCVVGPMEEAQALFVRAGVTDLKSPEDNSKAQTVRVLSTFIHHNFNSMNLDNNIALLRLQKPVELDKNTCVVCLPTSRKMPQEKAKCTVTGYGFVSPDGGMSLRIKEARVPIIDDMECMTNVTDALDNPFILPASSFCAGGEGQVDACQGDAGGALVCEVGGFYEIVGLVSWGLGCGREFVPSIYIKVPAFMGWINQIISSSSFIIP